MNDPLIKHADPFHRTDDIVAILRLEARYEEAA